MTPRPSPANRQVLVKAAALLQYSSASMIVITAAGSASLIFDKFKEPRPNKKLQRAVSIETELREVVGRIYRAEHGRIRSAARANISGPNAGTSP